MPRRARRYIGRCGHVLAVEEDLAVVGRDLAGGHAEAGGLAGAVGAEQADDLADVDLEVDAVHDLAAAVELDQPALSRMAIDGPPDRPTSVRPMTGKSRVTVADRRTQVWQLAGFIAGCRS